MHLVIVESPSKARTINKYLGKDYLVKASKGHIIDLPKSKMGIDIENGFKPQYEVTNKQALAELRKAFKQADKLILAVDLDREGEAIGWHVARELKAVDNAGKQKGTTPVERIVFHEISKQAIQQALQNPRHIDINLVNAQQARRLLDRIVGYKLSPLLWKKITFGLSAGRVQSVALRLVVEREEEREAFKPEEYWSIESFLHETPVGKPEILYHLSNQEEENEKKDKKKEETRQGIKFELSKIKGKKPVIPSKDATEHIIHHIQDKDWVIHQVQTKISKRYPKPPFITSTMQQTAVNYLGFSAKRTMVLAQKLYEAGHITYMRTDSVFMSDATIKQGQTYITQTIGKEYIPEKTTHYKSSNKSAQEAHECIHPVDLTKTSDALSLKPDEKKLYDLIWRRALSSLMKPAEIENLSVIIPIDPYEFKATGSRVLFDGFLKLSPEKVKDTILPPLKKDQTLYPKTIHGIQHFTQPPARYSEATLIKKLEELGIGRPSTYATIISTIISRRYVVSENKYLSPTEIGRVVNKLLTKYFFKIVDYQFTAGMEENLDSIAEGKRQWIQMLDQFYQPFNEEVEKQDKLIPRSEFTELGTSDKTCPVCQSPMVIKLGRYGKFLSCSQYPKCKGMLSLDGKSDEDLAKETETEEFKNKYEPAPKTDDGRDYALKTGRYGKFWAHPDYPKVKDAQPLILKRAALIELYGEIPKTEDNREYVLKRGRFGEFWAHPDYPDVKKIVRIKKKKTE